MSMVWKEPPQGYVKFNVDGSTIGKPGPAGIRGILRDHQGVCVRQEVGGLKKSLI
ncbi:hypothetical protein PTKIN_Ptkin10aG0040200 [Pterospermum kingtungense]